MANLRPRPFRNSGSLRRSEPENTSGSATLAVLEVVGLGVAAGVRSMLMDQLRLSIVIRWRRMSFWRVLIFLGAGLR